MTPRAELAAKKMLESAERRLVDVRVLRERLTHQLDSSGTFRPTLEHALEGLIAVTPGLERDFNSAYDVLRSVCFVQGLDPSRLQTRAWGSPRGPRRYRDKSPRSRAR
jgi:hypothetical protein